MNLHTIKKKPNFLVLDDEEMTAKTIADMASSCGYESNYVTEPDHFFSLIKQTPPDVIALDLMMSKMDGVEVIKCLAKLGCLSKLILTSGLQSKTLNAASDSARAQGLNILGVLTKPFTKKNFTQLLEIPESVIGYPPLNVPQRPTVDYNALTRSDFILAMRYDDQIHVHYQPKVVCKTGTLDGFEVLARWSHPGLGFIPPDIFIPLAEKFGFIDELTKVIAKQALDWLADVSSHEHARELGFRTFQRINISMNISAKSLNNTELFDWLYSYCLDKGIKTTRIILEITESSAMAETSTTLDNLTRLKMRGFHLSIDDFGTGYSSMVQLARLPFSEIKVDKSFVMQALNYHESKAIVKSIIDLGRSLELNTTAEGIEDSQTLAFVRELGCKIAQGYFISPPLRREKIQDWFLTWEHLREQQRQQAIEKTGLLDSLPEERFDRITRLAKTLFNTPISIVSFVDQERQWFKSKQGVEFSEVTRCVSFCTMAIESDDELIITDTHADERYNDNPFVTGEPHIRFYAGHPLSLKNGIKIGTFCVIDTVARGFSDKERKILRELAVLVEQELYPEQGEYSIEYHSGLLCRETFKNRAESYLSFCKKVELPLTIFSLHLSGLSQVNLAFGVEEGDRVLRDCAQILSSLTPNDELVGRYRNTRIALLLINVDFSQADNLQAEFNSKLTHWSKKNPEIASLLNLKHGFSHKLPSDDILLETLIEQSLRPHEY